MAKPKNRTIYVCSACYIDKSDFGIEPIFWKWKQCAKCGQKGYVTEEKEKQNENR
jgi:DNA-directed RNA polymerase subunit RPC12/RpoP